MFVDNLLDYDKQIISEKDNEVVLSPMDVFGKVSAMSFTTPICVSDELEEKLIAKHEGVVTKLYRESDPVECICSVNADDSPFGMFAGNGFSLPIDVGPYDDWREKEVRELSLYEKDGCLFTRKCDKGRIEMVANFVLVPIEIQEVQRVANGEFVAESITFRVKLEGNTPLKVTVPIERIEKLDVEISKRQGKCVVTNRAAFNDYIQELRIQTADCVLVKRYSEVEGWIEQEDGTLTHTAFFPEMYVTSRDYTAVQSRSLDIPTSVENGTKFLGVGKYGSAIQAMFLVAHTCYLYPFLKRSGLRPEFLVVIEAPSGSYKTGSCRELFNVFTEWDERMIAVINSTAKGIIKGIVKGYRHESVLVDDIAPGSKKQLDKSRMSLEDLTRFLSDKNKVLKSNLSQTVDVTEAPELICVVTAETGMLVRAESSAARHLTIKFGAGEFSLKEIIGFTNNQNTMKNYFAAFIHFLYEQQAYVLNLLTGRRNWYLEQATNLLPDAHPRIVGNLKVLFAVNDVVSVFEKWAGMPDVFVRERAEAAQKALVGYCRTAAGLAVTVKTEELFIQLLTKGLRDGDVKVVELKELRKLLLEDSTMDITGIALKKNCKDGNTILIVEPEAWYQKVVGYASSLGVVADKTKDEMAEALLLKGYTAKGDTSKGLYYKVSSKINDIYNRPRWLGVFVNKIF